MELFPNQTASAIWIAPSTTQQALAQRSFDLSTSGIRILNRSNSSGSYAVIGASDYQDNSWSDPISKLF